MRYHEKLKERHINLREETISEVLRAIVRIKAFEGDQASITAKKILNNSNLSRSVLYKEHILKIWNSELWEKRYISKSKIEKELEGKYKNNIVDLRNELEKVYFELAKQKSIVSSYKKKFEDEKKRTEVYIGDIDELKENMKKLRGEIFMLQSILDSRNIEY